MAGKQEKLNTKPINILAYVFWFLFGLFSVLIMLDIIDMTFTKGVILFSFFLVAYGSSTFGYSKKKD